MGGPFRESTLGFFLGLSAPTDQSGGLINGQSLDLPEKSPDLFGLPRPSIGASHHASNGATAAVDALAKCITFPSLPSMESAKSGDGGAWSGDGGI